MVKKLLRKLVVFSLSFILLLTVSANDSLSPSVSLPINVSIRCPKGTPCTPQFLLFFLFSHLRAFNPSYNQKSNIILIF